MRAATTVTGIRHYALVVADGRNHQTRSTLAQTNWLMTVTFIASGLFFLFTANDSPRGVNQPEPGWVIAGAGGVVISVVLAVRSWRAGALTRGDSLVIRNVFRTYRIDRSEVVGFAIIPAPVLGYPRTVVCRASGPPIPITTLSPPRLHPDHSAVQRAIADLESWQRGDPDS